MSAVYPSQSILGFDPMNGVSAANALNYLTDPVKIESLIARIQALEAWTRLVSLSAANNSSYIKAGEVDTKSFSLPTPQDVKRQFIDETTVTTAVPTAPATPEQCDVEPFQNIEHVKTANQILDIVESYGISEKTNPDVPAEARNRFMPIILSYIEKGVAIPMVLPAFPFKSPNRTGKALGSLPDLGEEVALAHLQGFCDTVGQVYQPGTDISIASDGLVYNDLLRVSDDDVWSYGEALRQLALDRGFKNIKFMRLADLLRIPQNTPITADSDDCISTEENRAHYLTHAGCFRRELVARYEPPGFDVKKAIKQDTDTCLTYRGYLRFLKKDLELIAELRNDADGAPLSAKKYDKNIGGVAQAMITRGSAFAAAVKATHGDFVRLSIHPTTAVTKFPVQLIPQKSGSFGMTPWHSSVAVGLDGSFTTGHAEDFKKTHDLIYRYGRPYYFREKSDLFDWGELKVEFEHQYPCGVIITPAEGKPAIRRVPMDKVRGLSINMSPVVLRGFEETLEEDVYTEKAHEIGKVLPWTFGIVQKVKNARVETKMGNNVTSNEGMPMHWDGMFKVEERTNAETGEVTNVNCPPAFQFFTAQATAPAGSGYTLFASSRLFFQNLQKPYSLERFEKIRWAMDNNGFWDAKLKDLPLVVRHPVNNTPCLRWHEPWTEEQTKFSTCAITLVDEDPIVTEVVTKLLYDYRVCLRFSWNVGDWLINDNTSMLHTRTGYSSDCERELWRIHFD